MKSFIILLISIATLLIRCSPSGPFECDDPKVKTKLVDEIKTRFVRQNFAITRQLISVKDVSITIESITTIEKNENYPYYRKCEMSYTMPAMLTALKKEYEINKNEDGDIMIGF